MAKDESLRRTNISERDLDDTWTGKASRNKLTGEQEIMYVCPECGHHAFHLSPAAGRFHCWACGIFGLMTDGQQQSTHHNGYQRSTHHNGYQRSTHHNGQQRSTHHNGYQQSTQPSASTSSYSPLGGRGASAVSGASSSSYSPSGGRGASAVSGASSSSYSPSGLKGASAVSGASSSSYSPSGLKGAFPSGSSGASSQLDDYMPLDDELLSSIQDISLDEHVTGLQQNVRDYLTAQQIPLEWAHKMRWGAAVRYIKLKDEEQGKQRPCLVFRNYVEGYCCNVKFRCVSKKTSQPQIGVRPQFAVNENTLQTAHSETTSQPQIGVRPQFAVNGKGLQFEKGFEQQSSFTPCAPYNIDCLRPDESRELGSGPISRSEELQIGELGSGRSAPISHGVLYITEGEKDCLTLCRLGFVHSISAANGAQTDHERSFEAFREWLKPVRTVVVVGDQDLPGRRMVDALTAYFDDKEVRVARWDKRVLGKDITEVMQRHGEDVARALVLEAEGVVREDIEDFVTDASINETINAARGLYDRGYSTGIGPVTDSHFRLFSMGGLIIVTGTPNTGKTDFLNFLTMSLVKERRSHVCFCSFETPNKSRHAGDLTQIWAGGTDLASLSAEEVKPLADYVMSHITHIRMRREKPTPEAVLRKAEVVMQRHPTMEYLVIDPYLYLSMRQGRNITETDAIKTMLTDVQDWAHQHHVWVFIVAHPRKLQKDDGSKELEEVDMYTIAGSANWANVADYVLSIKRIQTRGMQGQVTADYTRLSVLKVRDQKLCTPGDVFYNRQSSGRYDERATERDAQAGTGAQNLVPFAIG